jgi:hypothetical protein
MGWSKATLAKFVERRTKALDLNVRGRSLAQIVVISQEEGWLPKPYRTPQAVHEDLLTALRERHKARNEMADIYIQRELDKLDAMEGEAWRVLESLHYVVNQGELVYVYPDEQPDLVKKGWARPKLDFETRAALEDGRRGLAREPLTDNKPVLDALNTLLKIAERRAKLLGLDAPVKKQVEVSNGATPFSQIESIVVALFATGTGTLTAPAISAGLDVVGGGSAAALEAHPAGEREEILWETG